MGCGSGWARVVVALLAACFVTGAAEAQRGISTAASLRTRAEAWDWFDRGPEGRYVFSGTLIRGSAQWGGSSASARVELAAPILLNLPDDAVAPAPAGALGLGANYFAANTGDRHAAHLFPREAWIQFGGTEGHRLRLGRTEFADGGEVTGLTALRLQHQRGRRLIAGGTFSDITCQAISAVPRNLHISRFAIRPH